jgi:hypothetical protein
VIVAAGARAAERRLLAEIEAALPPGEIAQPGLVVVVPSHSLREHLLGRLAARRPAWLGLEVVTLAGAASAILARTGGAPRSGEAIVPLLVARLAAREKALASALGGLAGGYAEIEGAVSDLLDAGFDEAHVGALEERLDLERAAAGAAAVERARAIVRVAAGVRDELGRLGAVPDSERLAEAARRLAADTDLALPARALFVHGFADATGVASDLLESMVRHRPAIVLLDSPPELDGRSAAWRFGARLRERLAGVAALESEPATLPPARAVARRAADPAREALAAVAWLAAAEGAMPETSALVARDLADLPLWARELDRQSVAGSAAGGLASARQRRAAGLAEILERGDDAPIGTALATLRERLERAAGVPIGDLRLACGVVGVRTLGAADALARASAPFRLPIADRIAPDDDGVAWVRRREVASEALDAAASCLARLRAGASAMGRRATLGAQVATLRRWLGDALPADELEAFTAPLSSLAIAPLSAVEVDPEEWRRLVAAAWQRVGVAALGGGAGVALLSITEARGRTFSRLAVAGLSRDRFPRTVRPDPLLPDALRLRLRELLPDLPVKAEGHDEERYLFAQLLSAADEIALFRPLADGTGREVSPSPLFDEWLRRVGVEALPAAAATPAALDRAIDAALAVDHERLVHALPAAIREAGERFVEDSVVEGDRLAGARLALLAERDPDPSRETARRLGALFGRVGEVAGLDPRRRTPSVTALERLAGCGWRAFLERVLRLAPLPDLAEALPELPRRLVGDVVHHVLEGLAPEAKATLDEALRRTPLAVEWPQEEDLERRARSSARRALAVEGLDPVLFEAPLAREALGRLAVARAVDWPAGRRDLLAVEAGGEARLVVAGSERAVPFRVDRVERLDGEIWLTDYKTGRPLSRGVSEKTRARHLAKAIAAGETLQLPVYLLGVAGQPSRARYLQLVPDLDERAREVALNATELDREAIAAVLETLFCAWDAGIFVPRLLEPDLKTVFAGCASCDVREACVQGDSGARLRLARWATAAAEGEPAGEPTALAWWRLRGGHAVPEGES